MTASNAINYDDSGIPETQWDFFKAVLTGELTGMELFGITRTTTIRLPVATHARLQALHEISGLSFNACVVQALGGALERAEQEVTDSERAEIQHRSNRILQELIGSGEPVRTMRDGTKVDSNRGKKS